MIPIKGYATFDPLKHCWIGSGFQTDWFKDLSIYKNKKIIDPLKRIAEETEEDYQALEKLLQSHGVQTYRSFLDIEKYGSLKNDKIQRPPLTPRDYFAVIGEKFYATGGPNAGFVDVIKQIDPKNIVLDLQLGCISTAEITRVGKDLFWDYNTNWFRPGEVEKYTKKFQQEGYRVHHSTRGEHSDGLFCVVKPGCIVTVTDVQDYSKLFPGWDVFYLPDQTWGTESPFQKIKNKVGGKWWLKGEEDNNQLIEFVNSWLDTWVGYVEETVFDVNMLSLDQNHIICNNYHKEVFDFFKKHKVEPILFNFRHKYFWDGGVHCITQDLYREGELVDYLGKQ